MFRFLRQLYVSLVDTVFTSLYNDMDGVKVVKKSIFSRDTINEEKSITGKQINRRYLFPTFLYLAYLFDILFLCLGNGLTGSGPSAEVALRMEPLAENCCQQVLPDKLMSSSLRLFSCFSALRHSFSFTRWKPLRGNSVCLLSLGKMEA